MARYNNLKHICKTIIVPRKSLKESILIIATKITIIKGFLVKRLLKVMHNLIKKLTAGAVGAGHQAIDSGLRAKGEDSAKICGKTRSSRLPGD